MDSIVVKYLVADGERRKLKNGSKLAIGQGVLQFGEKDTVIVSKSIRCIKPGHRVTEKRVLIYARKKDGTSGWHLFSEIGFCKECGTYRMSSEDYRAV